jgi:hypothetical protein
MIPSFYYFSSFENDDIICLFHGLESMGNDDHRTSLKEFIESLGDSLLAKTIKSTCWFIKEDDLRIFQKYLRNRESLFLASGESDSTFSDLGIETFLEFEDEVTVSET